MKHAFNCPPNPQLAGAPLVGDIAGALAFEWDDEAGTVSGPGAQTIRALIRRGEVEAGPHPRCAWPLDAGSLKRRADMAAIVGHAWIVPDELADAYPDTADPEIPAQTFTDADGVVVIGRDRLMF